MEFTSRLNKIIFLNCFSLSNVKKCIILIFFKKGTVVCHRESTFGRVMWKIKPVEVDFPESLELFKWFARFFLEGEVCENLKKYENVLLASPSTMLKSWAK